MKKQLLTALLVGALIFGISQTSIEAGHDHKIRICHASGQVGTFQYESLYIDEHAVFGNGGHFYENGTTRAGHENDYMGACRTPSPSPSPSPTRSLSPRPTDTPTSSPSHCPTHSSKPTKSPEPTNSPEPTKSPEPTDIPSQTPDPNDKCTNIDGVQTNIPEGWFQISPDSTFCRQFEYGGPSQSGSNTSSQPQGQVLGASTMAGTGSFQENLYLAIMTLGALLTFKNIKAIKKI